MNAERKPMKALDDNARRTVAAGLVRASRASVTAPVDSLAASSKIHFLRRSGNEHLKATGGLTEHFERGVRTGCWKR